MNNAKNKQIRPKIINISSRELSSVETKLLKRSLKFAPTPKANKPELKTDMEEFGRKLRLLEHFNGRNEQNTDNSLVRNKSNFVPQMTEDKYLSTFLEATTKYHEHLNGDTAQKSNIAKNEWEALHSLQNDNSIVIKEADKGGTTVIMDSTFYKQKLSELLSEEENYIDLGVTNKDDRVIKKVENVVRKHGQQLTDKEKNYIKNFAWRTSNFYGLPKIHKSKSIKDAVATQNAEYIKLSPDAAQDLKFRPIVAGPCSPTHRLSNVIDLVLKPLCKHVPSYIRDDLDFLNQIPEEVDENTILVSFDVVSLYTNIPHDLGIQAIEYWLDNYNASLQRPFSKEFILEAILTVLKENTFQFDGHFYKQLQGTAMGTKMAPTYATLVMGYLEEQLYRKYEEINGSEKKEELIKLFKRFLDDCFLPWHDTEEKLQEFHSLLNSLHDKIQFTMEKDERQLPFLDVLVYKEGRRLHTDIFYKETDAHQYLHFKSSHPKHVKNNIPYSLARRICCIVSKPDIRDKRLEELTEFLLRQSYPRKLIVEGIKKAKAVPPEALRAPKNSNTNNKQVLPLVITHNPNNPQIVGKIKQDLKFLDNSPKLKQLLDKTDLIVSRRQPKNLKQYLTRAEFNSNRTKPTITRCDEPRCGTCEHIFTGDSIQLRNGQRWEIRTTMNCKARNVIYILSCENCDSFYIGQTENLRKRVTLHKQQIRHEEYRHLTVSKHLASCSDGHFKIMPIYQCQANANRLVRESKESDIINKLKPNLNVF